MPPHGLPQRRTGLTDRGLEEPRGHVPQMRHRQVAGARQHGPSGDHHALGRAEELVDLPAGGRREQTGEAQGDRAQPPRWPVTPYTASYELMTSFAAASCWYSISLAKAALRVSELMATESFGPLSGRD